MHGRAGVKVGRILFVDPLHDRAGKREIGNRGNISLRDVDLPGPVGGSPEEGGKVVECGSGEALFQCGESSVERVTPVTRGEFQQTNSVFKSTFMDTRCPFWMIISEGESVRSVHLDPLEEEGFVLRS